MPPTPGICRFETGLLLPSETRVDSTPHHTGMYICTCVRHGSPAISQLSNEDPRGTGTVLQPSSLGPKGVVGHGADVESFDRLPAYLDVVSIRVVLHRLTLAKVLFREATAGLELPITLRTMSYMHISFLTCDEKTNLRL